MKNDGRQGQGNQKTSDGTQRQGNQNQVKDQWWEARTRKPEPDKRLVMGSKDRT
jgi:hypothetical protein